MHLPDGRLLRHDLLQIGAHIGELPLAVGRVNAHDGPDTELRREPLGDLARQLVDLAGIHGIVHFDVQAAEHLVGPEVVQHDIVGAPYSGKPVHVRGDGVHQLLVLGQPDDGAQGVPQHLDAGLAYHRDDKAHDAVDVEPPQVLGRGHHQCAR